MVSSSGKRTCTRACIRQQGANRECSSTIANNSELDALYSVIDHMDVLNQSFYDFNDDMSYYLHEKGIEGEAWEKAEKINQQREGYTTKN